jgi:hypothetical protein
MAIDLFKNYGVVLNSLICETMMCTPDSWVGGNISIERVNDSIVSKITTRIQLASATHDVGIEGKLR